jgi:chaperonin GroES
LAGEAEKETRVKENQMNPETLETDLAGLVEDDKVAEDTPLKPFLDRLLCEEFPEPPTSRLEIPSVAHGRALRVRVVAVGEGKLLPSGELFAIPFVPGDVVWHGEHSGEDIKIRGKSFRILRMEEVIAREC